MNYRMVFRIVGRVLEIEAILLLLPLLCALICGEPVGCFLLTILITVAVALLLSGRHEPEDKKIYAAEGFVSVALSWIALSLCGALPYLFSGAIPGFMNALFETVSGFTTTGATVVANVEGLPMGISFWRCFTHWIGGMGVLVFVMAVMPLSEERSMHIMRAEVPGPIKGKLVPRMRHTALILYLIYIGLTLIETLFLKLGGMSWFDALLHSFSTAGTGGFGTKNTSIAYFDSVYIEMVISVFELLFGINFNLYFLILIKKFRLAFANEELHWFLGIVAFVTVTISLFLCPVLGLGEALRQSFFQVCTIITTTGFSTADFTLWPQYASTVLVVLMLCGACAGSTGGGIKLSRFIILFKSIWAELRHQVYPRRVSSVSCNGKPVDKQTITSTQVYFGIYFMVLFLSLLLLSLDGHDFSTNITAVISCLSNIGPGLGQVGPAFNYMPFSALAKLLLSLCMLLGRLEFYPLLMLLIPSLRRR